MLQFFRKHQKVFFIFITVVIIISFTFFGTYSTITTTEEKSDVALGKAIDGSALSSKEVEAMARFFSSSKKDWQQSEKGHLSSLLNDEFFLTDLFKSGMAALVVEPYFDSIKEELSERLEKTRHYRPYVHPHAKFLGAEIIWKRYAPLFESNLALLKTKTESDFETFQILCSLYKDASICSPELLRRFVSYQESQLPKVSKDPSLPYADLALFGFHSLEDWFGPKCVSLLCQFVINVAKSAEKKGYSVTKQEARASLYKNAADILREFDGGQELTSERVVQFTQQHLRGLGIEEGVGVEIWRKALLFRRLFDDVGNSIFVDRLLEKQMQTYAQEKVALDFYTLPDPLKLRDFHSLLTLQVYLDALSPAFAKTKGICLDIPDTFLSLEEVEKVCPELVEKQFPIAYASLNKDELALNLSLKEIWEWQLADDSWKLLTRTFSELKGEDQNERFKALEKLAPEMRAKVDKFTCDRIISSHPEWIETALSKKEMQSKTVRLRLKGESFPFVGVKDPSELISLLETTPFLNAYSADGVHFYRIKSPAEPQEKKVMTFDLASKEGVLARMLDKKLEEAYPEAKKKNPAQYQRADGSTKPLTEVKNEVGAFVFAPLLKMLDQVVYAEENLKDKPALDKYAQYRLFHHLNNALTELKKHEDDTSLIVKNPLEAKEGQSLLDQFRLVKEKRDVKRSEAFRFTKGDLFALSEGSLSKIFASPEGGLGFCRLLERGLKGESQTTPSETQKLLGSEAKRKCASEIMLEITHKKGIAL